jgi:hypothetical protein
VSNQAYLSIWCKEFVEERMLERLGAFLTTVPFSATKPGFSYLVIRAVDSAETPVFEQDLRALPLDAASVVELAKDYLHSDCSYEVQSNWDLWTYESLSAKWRQEPQPLEMLCHGEDYDNGFWRENGHLEVNLGFEHFFTGHAGLLGMHPGAKSPAQSPEEAQFLEAMAWPENLEVYQEKTRENIRKVLEWSRRVEKALPVAQIRLWSEGEENFEARLEEILAAR